MIDEDVIDGLGMHAAAVALLVGMGYAWIGGAWTQNTPKEYGCHCDLEPGWKPDGFAAWYFQQAAKQGDEPSRREGCHEWRPVEFVRPN